MARSTVITVDHDIERTETMSPKRRQSVQVLLVHVVAVTVGIAAAFGGLGFASAGSAAATSHCTRYAPAINDPDINCYLKGTMSGSGTYQTPSTALRDSNAVVLNASRGWHLWYPGTSAGDASGTGTSGLTGPSGGYHPAACAVSSSVTGYCTTGWHN